MADTTVLRLNPARLKLKPGESTTVTVTVANRTELVEHYRLYVEGGEPAWFEFDRVQLSAFPLEETPPARLRITLPTQVFDATYNLTILAISQNGENQGQAALPLEVSRPGAKPAAVPPPPPPATPKVRAADINVAQAGLPASPQILLNAIPASDPDVPPPGQVWQLAVKNGGRVLNTFSFCLVGLPASWAVIEPPQMILKPGESGQSLLKVRPGASAPNGNYLFNLRAFSHLNFAERTELNLEIEVSNESSIGGGTLIGTKGHNLAASLPQKVASPGDGQLEISTVASTISLAAGSRGRLDLTLSNKSVPELPVELYCQGLPPSWVSLKPNAATIPPRNQTQATLTVTPQAGLPSGVYPFSMRAIASQDQDLEVNLPLVLEVTEPGLGRGTQVSARPLAAGQPGTVSYNPQGTNLESPRILLSVDKPTLSVPPGASGELQIGIQNLTTRLDAVAVRLEGLPRDWVQIIQNDLTVFPQGSSNARVIIQPSANLQESLAGRYPLYIRGKSQENAGREGQATGELEVQLVGNYRLNLKKTEERGVQETLYPLLVANNANAPLRLKFRIDRPDQSLGFKFEPPEVQVQPGGETQVMLKVKPQRGVNQEQQLNFNILTEGEFILKGNQRQKTQVQQASGRFTQDPSTPLRVAINPPKAKIYGKNPATFEVQVTNPSPVSLKASLIGADRANAFLYRFEPVELRLPPNGEGRARLIATPVNVPPYGDQQGHAFRVTARSSEIAAGTGWADVNLLQINGPDAAQQLQNTRFTQALPVPAPPPPPPAPPPPPPPPKKSNALKWVLGGIAALIVVGGLAVGGLAYAGVVKLPFGIGGGGTSPTPQSVVTQTTPPNGQTTTDAANAGNPGGAANGGNQGGVATTPPVIVTTAPADNGNGNTETTAAGVVTTVPVAPVTTPAAPITTPAPVTTMDPTHTPTLTVDTGGTATAKAVALTAAAKALQTQQAAIAANDQAVFQSRGVAIGTPVNAVIEVNDNRLFDVFEIRNPNTILNFTTEATIQNPYDKNTGPWGYGFLFNYSAINKTHYRVYITSNGDWQFEYFNPNSSNINDTLTVVQKGKTGAIKTGAKDLNKLTLSVTGNFGYFFVNDTLVDVLELKGIPVPGNVAVGYGFQEGFKQSGTVLRVLGFKLAALPGNRAFPPTPPATPAQALPNANQPALTIKPVIRTPGPTFTPVR